MADTNFDSFLGGLNDAKEAASFISAGDVRELGNISPALGDLVEKLSNLGDPTSGAGVTIGDLVDHVADVKALPEYAKEEIASSSPALGEIFKALDDLPGDRDELKRIADDVDRLGRNIDLSDIVDKVPIGDKPPIFTGGGKLPVGTGATPGATPPPPQAVRLPTTQLRNQVLALTPTVSTGDVVESAHHNDLATALRAIVDWLHTNVGEGQAASVTAPSGTTIEHIDLSKLKDDPGFALHELSGKNLSFLSQLMKK